ncbi:MAG: hypothetical protein AB1352_00890 [Patescibacteria group bacterium]
MPATEAQPNIPSKDRKKELKNLYKQGQVGAGGVMQAKDRGDRSYSATGQRPPEGEKQGFLDKIRQRQAEHDAARQQQQYVHELARQKQNEKHMAGIGKTAGRMGKGMTKMMGGGPLANSFGAMAKSPQGVAGAMSRVAEREAAFKRMNDQQRNEWKKNLMKGNVKGAWDKFKKRPKKLHGIQARPHSFMVWLILIGMAVFKDCLDVGTLELASWLDWIVDALIGLTFWAMLGKNNLSFATRLVRSLGPALLEMIPGLGFIPIWTFSVLYIYFRSEVETKPSSLEEKKELPG